MAALSDENESTLVENITLKNRSDEMRIFDGTLTKLTEHTEIEGYVFYLYDVTHRKLIEERLIDTNFEW